MIFKPLRHSNTRAYSLVARLGIVSLDLSCPPNDFRIGEVIFFEWCAPAALALITLGRTNAAKIVSNKEWPTNATGLGKAWNSGCLWPKRTGNLHTTTQPFGRGDGPRARSQRVVPLTSPPSQVPGIATFWGACRQRVHLLDFVICGTLDR